MPSICRGAALALLIGTARAVSDGQCAAGTGGAACQAAAQEHLLLQTRATSSQIQRHEQNSSLVEGVEAGCCLSSWSDVKRSCSDCTALVYTAPHGGRCDHYCESIGMVCVGAAEEVNDDCSIKHTARCDEVIGGTSDMLCKCKKAQMGGECDAAIGARPAGASSSWVSSGQIRGHGWCAADVPASSFSLKAASCGNTEVRVLSYNLFWWNLFDRRGGNGGSAGRLIASQGPFDIMGFQECEDTARVLNDAGLGGSYGWLSGGSALGIAWKKSRWEHIGDGRLEVAEDRPEQWYGKRAVHWVRLRNKETQQTVFFMNHHGPLPVNTGGVCGGEATAYNIMKAMADHAEANDAKLLVGDFNADAGASTQATLSSRMHRAAHNWVDGVFGSCPGHNPQVRGHGGSDHEALSASFRI